MEEFREVPGYKDYQVSNMGRVKSFKGKGPKILRPGGTKYLSVVLRKGGKSKTFKVSVLVAMAFLDHVPGGYDRIVDHIDNNKLNDRLENLQIISTRENTSKDKPNAKSKYPGVSWCKQTGKWRAAIKIKDKIVRLGRHNSELEAAKKYRNKLKEIQVGTKY